MLTLNDAPRLGTNSRSSTIATQIEEVNKAKIVSNFKKKEVLKSKISQNGAIEFINHYRQGLSSGAIKSV